VGAGGEAGGREAGLNPSRATAALARFLAGSRLDDVPEPIRRQGKRAILNLLGCILAGRDDPAVQLVRRVFPAEDALVDAAAATAHDYDDTHLPTVIHATPPVGAAAFALAKRNGSSGAELLHAFILGVETSCRLGNAVMPGHYEHGWHITSTCGVFGAAAAAAKLLRLDETRTVSALGIAATQAAGLVEVLGSMARVLNAGFAARNGIAAALLAQQGFEGPRDPLEGLRGFMNVFGGNHAAEKIAQGLGEAWELLNVQLKPYPSGVVLHALIDACLEQREALRRTASIVVEMHPLAIERTDRPEPRNAIEARLSAQHAVAVSVLHGAAGLAEFTDAAAVDSEVRKLRARVRVAPDPSLDKMAARLRTDAASFEAPASRPMDEARLEAKLRSLAGARATDLLETVRTLEALPRVSLP
jgi:2-methylcitrate dehydratase PrpD